MKNLSLSSHSHTGTPPLLQTLHSSKNKNSTRLMLLNSQGVRKEFKLDNHIPIVGQNDHKMSVTD